MNKNDINIRELLSFVHKATEVFTTEKKGISQNQSSNNNKQKRRKDRNDKILVERCIALRLSTDHKNIYDDYIKIGDAANIAHLKHHLELKRQKSQADQKKINAEKENADKEKKAAK